MKRFSICVAIAALAWMPSVVSADEIKDSWLTSKTKVRLLAEKRVKSTAVSVDTEDAVVTLRGKVRTANERWAAEQIARQTDGVRGVNNLLQIVPEQHRRFVDSRDGSVKDSVKAKLERDQILKDRGGDIAVRVDNGMVTLTGKVDDTRARNRASDLIRSVSGVKSVRNELKIREIRAATATPR